jgi:Transglutaminase-like enzymes, putative cysteine proteases
MATKKTLVKNIGELEQYMGINITNVIEEADRREAYLCNWEQMKANYGDNVDFQLRYEQVMLCPETSDFIYNGYTSTQTFYVKGTRPELEGCVERIIMGSNTDREKVMEIMKFCRDLYKKSGNIQLFYGGTEEELIKKGERLCECIGRLMVGLCEIAGIPGRIIMHVIGGHIVSEVYFEGKWAYIDPRFGMFYLMKDGNFASLLDLWNHPEIITAQDEKVKQELSALWTWEKRVEECLKKFFHKKEIIVLNNYSLMQSAKYGYNWITHKDALENGINEAAMRYSKAIAQVFGIESNLMEARFDFSLADGQVVSGKIPVFAFPIDFIETPTYIDLYIDDRLICNMKGTKVYRIFEGEGLFDTKAVGNGSHRLGVRSKVQEGKEIFSKITINVSN